MPFAEQQTDTIIMRDHFFKSKPGQLFSRNRIPFVTHDFDHTQHILKPFVSFTQDDFDIAHYRFVKRLSNMSIPKKSSMRIC